MRKLTGILSLVLLVQVVLSALLMTSSNRMDRHKNDAPLLAFNSDRITTLWITDANGDKVVMNKTADDWVLPDSNNYPVGKNLVPGLLTRLADLKEGMAVADSNSAAKRFKVSDDSFERLVQLSDGDDVVASFWLGSSASMHQTHVRVKGEDEIYLADIAENDLPTEVKRWQDLSLAAIKADEIQQVSAEGVSVSRSKAASSDNQENWELNPLPDGKQVNENAVQSLIYKIANLKASDIISSKSSVEFSSDQPLLTVDLTLKGDETATLEIDQEKPADAEKGNNSYVLKSSLHPYYFHLSKSTAEGLIKAFDVDGLSKTPDVVSDSGDKTDATTVKNSTGSAETEKAEAALVKPAAHS